MSWDWIVVGGGVTGAAAAYELSCQGLRVLLLEPDSPLRGGTRFGYGGLPYWSGQNDWARQLCEVGIQRHRQLSSELDYDTEFREGSLLMLIPPDRQREQVLAQHALLGIVPTYLDERETQRAEPLLNPAAHQGALRVPHAHVRPTAMAAGLVQGLLRQGGKQVPERVVALQRTGERWTGVQTSGGSYEGGEILVCAGAWSRGLLRRAGIWVPLYFTHAELLETDPWSERLNHFIQTVGVARFELEAASCAPDKLPLWDQPGQEPAPAILDPGIFQMRDGSLRLGQISRTLTDADADTQALGGAEQIRQAVTHLLPALATVPARWYHCLVAFTPDSLPLIGAIPDQPGLYIFSGFSNPLLLVPTLARCFAKAINGDPQPWLEPTRVDRFPIPQTGIFG
ncbi:MAG: FAD-binding oxidoreductase [Thermostichales cyanobacterium BF3_bins_165]